MESPNHQQIIDSSLAAREAADAVVNQAETASRCRRAPNIRGGPPGSAPPSRSRRSLDEDVFPVHVVVGDEGAEEDMEPCLDQVDCPNHYAARPYRYALEVPKGGLGDLGIGAGAHLSVGGSCS